MVGSGLAAAEDKSNPDSQVVEGQEEDEGEGSLVVAAVAHTLGEVVVARTPVEVAAVARTLVEVAVARTLVGVEVEVEVAAARTLAEAEAEVHREVVGTSLRCLSTNYQALFLLVTFFHHMHSSQHYN